MLKDEVLKQLKLCDEKIANTKETLRGLKKDINKSMGFFEHDPNEIYCLMSLSSSFKEYVYDLDRLYFAKQALEATLKEDAHNG